MHYFVSPGNLWCGVWCVVCYYLSDHRSGVYQQLAEGLLHPHPVLIFRCILSFPFDLIPSQHNITQDSIIQHNIREYDTTEHKGL